MICAALIAAAGLIAALAVGLRVLGTRMYGVQCGRCGAVVGWSEHPVKGKGVCAACLLDFQEGKR